MTETKLFPFFFFKVLFMIHIVNAYFVSCVQCVLGCFFMSAWVGMVVMVVIILSDIFTTHASRFSEFVTNIWNKDRKQHQFYFRTTQQCCNVSF